MGCDVWGEEEGVKRTASKEGKTIHTLFIIQYKNDRLQVCGVRFVERKGIRGQQRGATVRTPFILQRRSASIHLIQTLPTTPPHPTPPHTTPHYPTLCRLITKGWDILKLYLTRRSGIVDFLSSVSFLVTAAHILSLGVS